jgi:phosphohistidine phosphatase
MPTLFVLRHAKSSWNNSVMTDHERPLAPRGQQAAETMAAHISALTASSPDGPLALVLCSTARRAQDTLEPLALRLPESTELIVDDDLYGAPADDILARLRVVHGATPSVLVIGHNPGLEDLVRSLGTEGDPELIARVREKFPTAAFATLTFDGSWDQLRPGTARLAGFVVPDDLE